MLSEERVHEIDVLASAQPSEIVRKAFADLLTERQDAIRLSNMIGNQRDELARERMVSRFEPIGANHHNAQLCPYCNPRGYFFATLKVAADLLLELDEHQVTGKWLLRAGVMAKQLRKETERDRPKQRLGDVLETMGPRDGELRVASPANALDPELG